MRLAIVLLFALSSAVSLKAEAQSTPSDIDRLINQLGDEDFAAREAAITRLVKIGEPALAALKKATQHADPEIRRRARETIVRIEDRAGRELRTIRPGPNAQGDDYRIHALFSGDGRHAIALGGDVVWIDLETGKQVKRLLQTHWPRLAQGLSRDGRFLATSHQTSDRLHVLDTLKMDLVGSCHNPDRFDREKLWRPEIRAAAFSHDGDSIALGGGGKTIRIYDAKTFKELVTIDHGEHELSALAFSPDGQHLASAAVTVGYQDRPVYLWDLKTKKVVKTFTAHDRYICTVLFTPDGKKLLTAGNDGWMILWDVATGKELKRMTHSQTDPDSVIVRAAISPDGKRALTAGGPDRTLRVWDLDTGKTIRVFDTHTAPVGSVAFSPDGRRALSCDAREIKLWKLPE